MFIEDSGRLFVESRVIDLYALQKLRASEQEQQQQHLDKHVSGGRAPLIIGNVLPSATELTEAARAHLRRILHPPSSEELLRPWAPTPSPSTATQSGAAIPPISHTFSYHDGALLRDFLISCCEPSSRTQFMSEYVLTQSSLSAAAAEGRYSSGHVRAILLHYIVGGATTLPPLVEQLLCRHSGGSRLKLVLRKCLSNATNTKNNASEADLRYYLVCDSQPYLNTIVHKVPEYFDKVHLGGSGAFVFSHRDEEEVVVGSSSTTPITISTAIAALSSIPPNTIKAALTDLSGSLHNASTTLTSKTATTRSLITMRDSVRQLLDRVGTKRVRDVNEDGGNAMDGPLDVIDRVLGVASKQRPSYSSDGDCCVDAGTATSIEKQHKHQQPHLQYFAQVRVGHLRSLRRALHTNLQVDVDCYYDFTSDVTAKHVPNFSLREGVQLRPYQRASLERFVQARSSGGTDQSSGTPEGGHKTAHHGVVVLPCGAGKTLTGIAASAMVGKRTIVMCINVLSVLQWRDQFLKWTDLRPEQVTICTKDEKQIPGDIFITTYSMLTARSKSDTVGKSLEDGEKLLFGLGGSNKSTNTNIAAIGAAEEEDEDQAEESTLHESAEDKQYRLEYKREAAAAAALKRKDGLKNSNNRDSSSGSGALDLIQQSGESENAFKRRQVFHEIEHTAWGMLVLDEVHVAPAKCFQVVVDKVKHKCIIGLSATLLREDMKIDDLRFLVGPKLYEANWLELTHAGHLAPVVCAEVRCPLPPQLLIEYVSALTSNNSSSSSSATIKKNRTKKSTFSSDDDEDYSPSGKSKRGDEEDADGGHHHHHHLKNRSKLTEIECLNPFKLWCTQALIAFHESQSPPDKIIIFCDSKPAAHFYARVLGVPLMVGEVRDSERSALLQHFVKNPAVNTIILSRVGDIALDLPEASVIIQISGLFSSRRQEAQRLGRILRPKPVTADHGMSYFYTLASQDTDETMHSANRQEWLRDQGYSYRLLPLSTVMSNYFQQQQQQFICNSRRTGTLPAWGVPRQLVCVGTPKWYFRVPCVNFNVHHAPLGATHITPTEIHAQPRLHQDLLSYFFPGAAGSSGAAAQWKVYLATADTTPVSTAPQSVLAVLSGGGGDAARTASIGGIASLLRRSNSIPQSSSLLAIMAPSGNGGVVIGGLVFTVEGGEGDGNLSWRWVPFTSRNATAIEGGFVQGFHRARPRRQKGLGGGAAKFGGAASGFAQRHFSPLRLLEPEHFSVLLQLSTTTSSPFSSSSSSSSSSRASPSVVSTSSLIHLAAKRGASSSMVLDHHARHRRSDDISGAVLFDRHDAPLSDGVWATSLLSSDVPETVVGDVAIPQCDAAFLETSAKQMAALLLSYLQSQLPLPAPSVTSSAVAPPRKSIFAKKKTSTDVESSGTITAAAGTTTGGVLGTVQLQKAMYMMCGRISQERLGRIRSMLLPPSTSLNNEGNEDGEGGAVDPDEHVMRGTTLRVRRGAEVGGPSSSAAHHQCVNWESVMVDGNGGQMDRWGNVPSCMGCPCIDHLLGNIIHRRR